LVSRLQNLQKQTATAATATAGARVGVQQAPAGSTKHKPRQANGIAAVADMDAGS
jgi:hypothetical protein